MLPTYLVVLHNIGQMTHQLENICRLGQPVVITREEGFVAVKHNRQEVWSSPDQHRANTLQKLL